MTIPGSMENIPSDIALDIFSRVPAETVLECKLVCKSMGTLICQDQARFVKMHLSRQLNHLSGTGDVDGNNAAAMEEVSLFFSCVLEEPYGTALLFYGGQPSDIISTGKKYTYKKYLQKIIHPPMHNELWDHYVGSCNGLICMYVHHNSVMDPTYICNPIAREYVYLPQLVVNKEEVEMFDSNRIQDGEVDMWARVLCGFGFASSTNEYKVVRIHYPFSMYEGYVEVYTLGSGLGCRTKGTISMKFVPYVGGIYADGAIFFWLVDIGIVDFDLASEEFRTLIPFPPRTISRRQDDKYGLATLRSRLCLYIYKLNMEIWSFKKSNGKETWCLDFDIDFKGAVSREWWIWPISLTKKGEIILLYDFTVFYCYDPKTTKLKMISNKWEVSSTKYFFSVRAIPHVNNFVSLKAMGENSKTYVADDDTWDDDS